jgi:hypothetical protein
VPACQAAHLSGYTAERMTDRSHNWVVLLRVHEKADWCAYGPGTHREALDFRRKSTGCGMERSVAQLIPFHHAALENTSKEK